VDAVFLDERRRVVRALSGLAPWRVSPRVPDAESVLELPAGTVARTGLAKGAQVVIEGGPVASRAGAGGRAGTALCNLALAVLYSLFVAAHVSRAHGPIDVARVVSYAIIVQMTILAILFVAPTAWCAIRCTARTRSATSATSSPTRARRTSWSWARRCSC